LQSSVYAPAVTLEGERCTLRPWHPSDVGELARIANDPRVSRYITLQFPSPYEREDARLWIDRNRAIEPAQHFAIVADGDLAGGIGVQPGSDVHRAGAMVGYWLGRGFWHRGIAPDALRTFVPYAFEVFGAIRLWANVFSPNVASMRVLEKAGFTREALLRRAVVDRVGETHDEFIYALLRCLAHCIC